MSSNAHARLLLHIRASRLREGNRQYLRVSAAIRKHGVPVLQIFCIGTEEYIGALEIAAIKHFKTRNPRHGYNVALGGEGGMTPAIAQKISTTMKGRPSQTPGMTGKKHSAETLAQMSNSQKGHPVSDKARANMSAAHQRNQLADPEAYAARIDHMTTGRKGKPAHNKGKPMSKAQRKKLSEGWHNSRPRHTPQSNANRSAGAKERWQDPNYQENVRTTVKTALANPEWRKAQSERLKTIWAA